MKSFRLRVTLSAFCTLVMSGCARESSHTWGFVATLGNDTTSVERITQQGKRIVSEAIGRSPVVVRRRWEATVDAHGVVQRWTMDTHIANAPAGEQDLHHEFELNDGSVRLTRQTGKQNTHRTFANLYVRTVPWNAFVYGTYELLFRAARGLPDSTRIGQYFFEGWSEGNVGHARLRWFRPDSVGISSTGLAGSGAARLDDEGRMLSYSGQGTTYKQEVRRVADVPDLSAIFQRFAADERAKGFSRVLSARDTMRALFAGAQLLVDYSRPLARGRTLLGGLIPYDRVWRTGANAATQLTVTSPIRLGGVLLDSGTYTLWTLPSREHVQLIVNRQTGQWGTGYQSAHDIARVPMQIEAVESPVEQFTIRVDTAASCLVMEWGTLRWSVSLAAVKQNSILRRR